MTAATQIVDLAALPRSKAPYVQVASSVVAVPTSPRFWLGPVPALLNRYLYSEIETGPVRCYTLQNATITLDGLILDGDAAISSDWLNHPLPHTQELLRRLSGTAPKSVRRVDHRAVVLSGPGYHIYGHLLLDLLPRLFVLHQCGYDFRAERYIIPVQAPSFVADFLDLLGISRSQITFYDEASESLLVGELLVPTNLRLRNRFHPLMRSAVRFLIDALRGRLPPPSLEQPTRLFIERTADNEARTLENRDTLKAIAVAHQFTIVRPQAFSLGEQIVLFRGARQIVGEYGSGLHNCVFSFPGTVVCAIRGTSEHPGLVQSGLNEIMDQPLGYVTSATPYEAVDQELTIAEDMFRQALRLTSLLADEGSYGRWS